MMHSLNLQLRGNLAWTIAAAEGGWRVEVKHRSATPAQDVLDILAREHKRLDELMAGLLETAHHAGAEGYAAAFADFSALLRAHIAFEDGQLAPLCAARHPHAQDAHAALMLREHQEILCRLSLIEESIAADDREAIGAFIAILSGTLAKHEHREEMILFPRWRLALSELQPHERAEILARAASGRKDQRFPS